MSLYSIIYKLTWIIKEGIQNEIKFSLKYEKSLPLGNNDWKSLNFVQRVYYSKQCRSVHIKVKIIKYTESMYNGKNH